MTQESRPWDNHWVLERNRELAHVPLVPYPGEAAAREGNREASPFFKSLNGDWKFHCASDPASAPEGFYREDFNVSGWDTITVHHLSLFRQGLLQFTLWPGHLYLPPGELPPPYPHTQG